MGNSNKIKRRNLDDELVNELDSCLRSGTVALSDLSPELKSLISSAINAQSSSSFNDTIINSRLDALESSSLSKTEAENTYLKNTNGVVTSGMLSSEAINYLKSALPVNNIGESSLEQDLLAKINAASSFTESANAASLLSVPDDLNTAITVADKAHATKIELQDNVLRLLNHDGDQLASVYLALTGTATPEPTPEPEPEPEPEPVEEINKQTITTLYNSSSCVNMGAVTLSSNPVEYDYIMLISYWDTSTVKLYSSYVMPASSFSAYGKNKWIQFYNYDRVVLAAHREDNTSYKYSVGAWMIDTNSNLVPGYGSFGLKSVYGIIGG